MRIWKMRHIPSESVQTIFLPCREIDRTDFPASGGRCCSLGSMTRDDRIRRPRITDRSCRQRVSISGSSGMVVHSSHGILRIIRAHERAKLRNENPLNLLSRGTHHGPERFAITPSLLGLRASGYSAAPLAGAVFDLTRTVTSTERGLPPSNDTSGGVISLADRVVVVVTFLRSMGSVGI